MAKDDCSKGEQTLEPEGSRETGGERERLIPPDTGDSMGLELQSQVDIR